MLDLAQPELDVRVATFRRVCPRPIDHRGRHIDADGPSLRADLARREEDVHAGARSQVEHRLAALRPRQGHGRPAAQTEDPPLAYTLPPLRAVSQLARA